jgi:hypothetical protein
MPAATGRVVGVDVARCLALVGMMATHILPSIVDGEVSPAHQLAGGRASALFAVLAGTSLVLVAGTRQPLRGRSLGGMVAGTVVRATLIGLVGLVLGDVESGIAVILVYYAVLFVVAVPFLALRTRWLVPLALAWAVVGPVTSHLWRDRLPPTSYAVPSLASLAEPVALLRELVLTGYYPVLTWVPYILLGMAVGRADLRSWRAAGVLAGAGLWAVAVAWLVSDALVGRPGVRAELISTFTGAGWRGDLATTLTDGLYGVTPTGSPWWLAVRAPHSGTTFDLLMTGGSACLVIALCLVVGRLAPRATSVLFGAGAMTLTLYTLHVVLRSDGLWDGDDNGTFLGQVALVLAIGALYRLGRQRGPLEAVVGEISNGVRRAVAGRG